MERREKAGCVGHKVGKYKIAHCTRCKGRSVIRNLCKFRINSDRHWIVHRNTVCVCAGVNACVHVSALGRRQGSSYLSPRFYPSTFFYLSCPFYTYLLVCNSYCVCSFVTPK